MHTYDLTHFQNELPEALWKYLLTFLIGKLEKEFLNIFERATTEVMNNIQRLLDHPNAPICHLPLVVGAFMLKCKNIWYFEEPNNTKIMKYCNFLSKVAIPSTKRFLTSYKKKMKYFNLLNLVNNEQQFNAYRYFSYIFSNKDENTKKDSRYSYNIHSYINIPDNQVTVVDLEGNDLSDWDAKLIADEIKNNNNLDSIFLERNKIGDFGFEAILESLAVNTNISTLRLPFNNLTDASGHTLLEYLEIPETSLYSLSLNHNYFSSSMRFKIRKAWKDRSFGLSV